MCCIDLPLATSHAVNGQYLSLKLEKNPKIAVKKKKKGLAWQSRVESSVLSSMATLTPGDLGQIT